MYDAAGWHLDPYYDWGTRFIAKGTLSGKTDLPPNQAVASGNLRYGASCPTEKELVWETSLVRDFAVAVSSEYESLEQKSAPLGAIGVLHGCEQRGGRQALKSGCEALKFFNDKFGLYPYHQLTLAATGFDQGGMEYPTSFSWPVNSTVRLMPRFRLPSGA